MPTPPVTRASLLLRLNDSQDGDAWREFVNVYGPLVYEYGRKHGLQDADAADLTQEVLRTVAHSLKGFRYDPTRGTFRNWLFTVARTKRINLGMKLAREARGSGDTEVGRRLAQVPDQPSDLADSAEWNRAFEQRLLDWACARIKSEFKESTWRAFLLTVFDDVSPQAAAESLGITVGAVYAGRYRVTARLRDVMNQARFDSFDE
jgi:RNA polymerase sigma factor (sigma-70 family)